MNALADTITSLALSVLSDVGNSGNKVAPPADPSRAWWLTSFRMFGFQHFLPAGIALVGMSILAALGWKFAGTPRERTLRLPIATASLVYAISVSLWYVYPTHLIWSKSLPLHMCDIMVLVAPIALLTRNRVLRSLNCFWGVALCSQAFITPILTIGLDDAEYYFFWISHAIIIGSSLYDYIAGGFRPNLRDYAVCVGCGIVWVVSVFVINLLIEGANYGYVGKSIAGQTTIVDSLGEWPLRALWVALIAIAGCGMVFCGSLFFERCEGGRGNPRNVWPSRATLAVFFGIGLAMLAAGTVDAMDPKPPTPKLISPQPAAQTPPPA